MFGNVPSRCVKEDMVKQEEFLEGTAVLEDPGSPNVKCEEEETVVEVRGRALRRVYALISPPGLRRFISARKIFKLQDV